MDDLQQKRRLIEQGQLRTWARRGRGAVTVGHLPFHRTLLRALHRVPWVRARGEANARNAVIHTLRFTFEALPPAFCGFTILHLSDLHADGLTGLTESLSGRLQDLQVDLCVLTGDYRYKISGPCDAVYPNMEKILAAINTRYGIVGVLGNHDAAEKVPVLEQLGVTMLVNRALPVQHGDDTIWLVGLDDPHYYGCDDLPGALRDVPDATFKVLLVHTPELVTEAETHGVDLYLCGHTHGGQICMPWLGPVLSGAHCSRRYIRGAWSHKRMQGYTSAGVGVSVVPMRFFCPPEIVVIELCCTRQHTHPSTLSPME